MSSPVLAHGWAPNSRNRSPRTEPREEEDIEMDSLVSQVPDDISISCEVLPFSGHQPPFPPRTSGSPSPSPSPRSASPLFHSPHGDSHTNTGTVVESARVGKQKEVIHFKKWDSQDRSVFLTWKNVGVTASDGKNGDRAILQGLTGYAEPGEALAIMGPSGCGKSSLLDALAGRLGSNTKQSGDILINGRKQALTFGTSAYVTQDDSLMTTLTVKEAIYYSAQLQLPESMSKSEKKERAEMTIKEMGLQNVMNTSIGGWASKGLSGGQKRRVRICTEMLTRPKLLFMDEPTSGLDNDSSYHVMSRIVSIAREGGRTVIASIHQPSREVFELFHNLCLLSAGRRVYFGPISAASDFFAVSGFPCPTLRNPSDHYLRTINKDFDQDIEEGGGRKSTAEVIELLVQSYKSSALTQQVTRRVEEICTRGGGTLEKKGSQASFLTQSIVLTKRSFFNMLRELGYCWLRFLVYISLCLCAGTIFHAIGHDSDSIKARSSILMFMASYRTFMGVGGFIAFTEDMKIFRRERINGHYGVAAFVVGNAMSSIPFLFLISVTPAAIAYFLVGLQKNFEHFLYFSLVLFICMMLVESLMMVVASVVPNLLMGIITGAGIQGIMMLNGGFYRLSNELPKPFWKYPVYYISFHKYAIQGLYKNEFLGMTFPNPQAGGSRTITGLEILKSIWRIELGYSKWVDLLILFGMMVLYKVMFFCIIKLAEKPKPRIRSFSAIPLSKRSVHVIEQLKQVNN